MLTKDAAIQVREMVKDSGNNFHRGIRSPAISFSDIADIVLLYISFQVDVRDLANISMKDFRSLYKETVGYYLEHNKDKYQLSEAYQSELTGGTIEERYMFFYPGIAKYDRLSTFFRFDYQKKGWGSYCKEHIQIYVLPKWRENINGLDDALFFAEEFCERIRAISAGR